MLPARLLPLLLLLSFLPAVSSADADPVNSEEEGPRLVKKLIGTWRSNRDLTLVEMGKSDLVTEEDREMFDVTLGKVTITYSEKNFTTILDGETTVTPYKVLASSAGVVVIEYFDMAFHSMLRRRIQVFDDKLAVKVPGLGFDEIFTPVDRPAPAATCGRARRSAAHSARGQGALVIDRATSFAPQRANSSVVSQRVPPPGYCRARRIASVMDFWVSSKRPVQSRRPAGASWSDTSKATLAGLVAPAAEPSRSRQRVTLPRTTAVAPKSLAARSAAVFGSRRGTGRPCPAKATSRSLGAITVHALGRQRVGEVARHEGGALRAHAAGPAADGSRRRHLGIEGHHRDLLHGFVGAGDPRRRDHRPGPDPHGRARLAGRAEDHQEREGPQDPPTEPPARARRE